MGLTRSEAPSRVITEVIATLLSEFAAFRPPTRIATIQVQRVYHIAIWSRCVHAEPLLTSNHTPSTCTPIHTPIARELRAHSDLCSSDTRAHRDRWQPSQISTCANRAATLHRTLNRVLGCKFIRSLHARPRLAHPRFAHHVTCCLSNIRTSCQSGNTCYIYVSFLVV